NRVPISLIRELFDIIITSKFTPVCEHLIIDEQHGFCRGKSTVTNLAVYSEDLLNVMESHEQIDAVYTDFSKAFDRVPHKILIFKMKTQTVILNNQHKSKKVRLPLVYHRVDICPLCYSIAMSMIYVLIITCTDDCLNVQADLNALNNWCEVNFMQLNISKCKVMRLSRLKQIILFPYMIKQVEVESVNCIKEIIGCVL
ncbi:hypothetical protein D910_10673, partial [Dendroctonus ponderosae]